MTFLAKVFMHGRSQAVRLPKACRFEGREIKVTKIGERVILEPIAATKLMPWATIDAIGDRSFMGEGRDQPNMPESRVVFEP
ncbi:MAG: AbrB/MazE/SpoVT family DNA-binding domain-containing protein [Methylocystaceae bacterium]|jgi:antitoxin VapB|nr:AbrB/MazE/SpoVT family DNA-binding domain-containing protein [Methylocystaceae bacterium]